VGFWECDDEFLGFNKSRELLTRLEVKSVPFNRTDIDKCG
jgi:hypothetical protein